MHNYKRTIKAIARYLIVGLGVITITCLPFPGLVQEIDRDIERARETIENFPTDLEAAREQGKYAEAEILNSVGNAYMKIGSFEEAKKVSIQGKGLTRSKG